MGTNYYLYQKPPCKYCKRDYEPLHIGKSSYGWNFSLHVIPESGINNLSDWIKLFKNKNAIIKDEYGENISIKEMINIIKKRSYNGGNVGENLLRHKIDGHCIGHGNGTYDYIIGCFS